MNKLVSKNPIQRFKLGQKIEKLQDGGWAGYYTVGNWPKSGNYSTKTITKQAAIQTPQDGTYYEKTIGGKVVERGRWKNGKQIPIKETTINGGQLPIEVIVTGQRKTPTTQEVSKEVINVSPKSSTPKTRNATPISFKTAFNNARNAGQETFNWRGQTYNTRDKGEENYIFQNGKWVNPTNNITFQAPEFQSERIEVPLTASVTSPNVIIPNTITTPQVTYDRTGIRQLIRDKGFNPYQFNGAQRRALRMVMNGQGTDIDRAIVSGMGIFKKGGLISRNPIKRFKLNK